MYNWIKEKNKTWIAFFFNPQEFDNKKYANDYVKKIRSFDLLQLRKEKVTNEKCFAIRDNQRK